VRYTDLFATSYSHADPVEITIRLDDCSPPLGMVGVVGEPSKSFAGWLGLLAILEELLEPETPTEVPGRSLGQLHSGTQTDLCQDV